MIFILKYASSLFSKKLDRTIISGYQKRKTVCRMILTFADRISWKPRFNGAARFILRLQNVLWVKTFHKIRYQIKKNGDLTDHYRLQFHDISRPGNAITSYRTKNISAIFRVESQHFLHISTAGTYNGFKLIINQYHITF